MKSEMTIIRGNMKAAVRENNHKWAIALQDKDTRTDFEAETYNTAHDAKRSLINRCDDAIRDLKKIREDIIRDLSEK